MTRPLPGLVSGLLALWMVGCLDRGGLDPDDGPRPDAGTGAGGSQESGGAPGSGGARGTGGSASSGGAGAGGDSGGAGGMTGSGGKKGSGGAVGTGGKGASNGSGGATMCGPVCDIFCAHGNVLDAKGCPTCECKPGPICPAIRCAMACPTGYAKDAKGCDTCTCNPDPKQCPVGECGPLPPAPAVICDTGDSVTPPAAGAGTDPQAGAPLITAPFVCERNAAGKCVWQAGGCKVCPPVVCALACPYGFQVGADGCHICACKPPSPMICSLYGDHVTCAADANCIWLQPGCGEPTLASPGCYARPNVGCVSDAGCGQGHQCLKRVIDPCFAKNCASCAAVQTVCQ